MPRWAEGFGCSQGGRRRIATVSHARHGLGRASAGMGWIILRLLIRPEMIVLDGLMRNRVLVCGKSYVAAYRARGSGTRGARISGSAQLRQAQANHDLLYQCQFTTSPIQPNGTSRDRSICHLLQYYVVLVFNTSMLWYKTGPARSLFLYRSFHIYL